MSSIPCAECGRVLPAAPLDGDASRAGGPFPFGDTTDAAWGEFNGRTICPDCQSPTQQREVTERTIASIEREVERRQGEKVPSDAQEAALIAYAMALRAGLDAPHSGTTTQPGGDVERSDRGEGLRLSVAFTGAFLTGHPLDVRIDGYETLQRQLGTSLTWPQWRTEGLGGAGTTYDTGGGFAEAVPLVVARREGTDLLPRLSNQLIDCSGSASHSDAPAPILRATATCLAIDVYDLGVAVLTAWFEVVTAARVRLDAAARALNELASLRRAERPSALAHALQDIATNTAAQYGEAVVTAVPQAQRLRAWLSDSGPAVARLTESPGRLLWLHPVSVLRTAESARSAKRTALELAPTFRQQIRVEGGVFAAGIGSSAVVISPESPAELAPIRLTELHWAYYALYMEIDRGLLRVLDQQRWNESASLTELEQDADNVFADYLRVMNARARLDSELSSRGGDELAIWEAIAKVQKFDTVVQSVERKLEVLQRVAQRRLAQAEATRARLTANILAFLSLLTVVTVAGALIGIFLGSRSPAQDSLTLRVILIVTAFVITSFIFWVGFLRTMRGASPFARWRRSRSG